MCFPRDLDSLRFSCLSTKRALSVCPVVCCDINFCKEEYNRGEYLGVCIHILICCYISQGTLFPSDNHPCAKPRFQLSVQLWHSFENSFGWLQLYFLFRREVLLVLSNGDINQKVFQFITIRGESCCLLLFMTAALVELWVEQKQK